MSFISGKWRQSLHLEPPQGWMNDPNGLCFFNGKYHIYFQYSPESAIGDSDRGWGHYESSNLLQWIFTGFVIRPDIPEDRNGVYSGSAVVKDNLLNIFYTGNVKDDGDYDYITAGRGANVIRVTSTDGHSMSKKQVLLRNTDYPEFCSCHIRDPKVRYENGEWKMVLGARTLDNCGGVLNYSSNDLENWKYCGFESIPNFGYMWECPNYFCIDGHSYLSISPQGLPHGKTQFQNVYQSGYFNADNGLSDFTEWDYGFDFYAPQSFLAPDGRRILIGWMGIGDIPYKNPTTELGWQHCLTLPREITRADDGTLLQNPIKELEILRCNKLTAENRSTISVSTPFELIAKTQGSFEIEIADSVQLKYDSTSELFALCFTDEKIGGERTERFAPLKECNNIRVIADTSSLEIYLNDGRKALSTRFYPNDNTVNIHLSGLSAEIYSLNLSLAEFLEKE